MSEISHDTRGTSPGEAFAILADVLAALLDRHERELADARSARVACALTRPSRAARRRTAVPAPASTQAQEDALLGALVVGVGELAGAVTHVVLAPTAEGTLRVVGGPVRAIALTPTQARRLWAAVAALVATAKAEVTPGQSAWASLRRVHALLVGQSKAEPERLLVLGVSAGEGLAGVVIAAPAESVAGASWLPLAHALSLTVGARVEALRAVAAEETQGQAHDAFLSLMAHELRSPLTSVKGYAQLLIRQSRKNALPASVLRSTQAIEQQAMRLSEMIDEVHDAARIRRGRLELLVEPTDLVALVEQQVERWRLFSPEHDYQVTATVAPLVGEWDAHRVAQLIRDLLDNATRYSPSGGPISITLERADQHALLTIRDRGIGVAEADRERIFAYLYRAPEAQTRNLSGLGLGLYVSRHVAERLGGRLWLHKTDTSASATPSGSEFRLTLPLAESAPR
ncbi:MAG: HAMP domain-containing histidine kinase [Ktedonobacterales bacterium]|nr:HAMP domain-containing histidine kinase [Ktedonobacterales bacterium]